MMKQFPVIDPIATGENIMRLRKAKVVSRVLRKFALVSGRNLLQGAA